MIERDDRQMLIRRQQRVPMHVARTLRAHKHVLAVADEKVDLAELIDREQLLEIFPRRGEGEGIIINEKYKL